MSKYQEEIKQELKTGAESLTSRYSMEDFEGFDFEVQTKKGINCHLCGYALGFGFTVLSDSGKTLSGSEKVPCRYRLQAKNFPPKGTGKNLPESVLPEIMLKLVNSGVVDVVNKTETAKPKK